MPTEPARTAVTGAQGSNPCLPEPGFGGSYVKTPAAWRNGAVGAISIAVGPRSNDPGDHRSTHLPLASTTHSAEARPAPPVTIGIASAATRSAARTVIAPRSTPNRRVPTRTGRIRSRRGRAPRRGSPRGATEPSASFHAARAVLVTSGVGDHGKHPNPAMTLPVTLLSDATQPGDSLASAVRSFSCARAASARA